MKGQLHDKVAIVTGGGTGIGEAICLTFAREGAKVVVNGLPDDPIADVVTTILDAGGEAIPFAGDVATEEAASRCVAAAVAKYGHLDVRSVFLMTKYALPHLRETKGNIISAGSEGGVNGQPRKHRVWRHQGVPARVHGGSRCGTGSVRGARELRVSGPDRHRVDPQGNRGGRRRDREGAHYGDPPRPTRNA